MRRRDWQAAGLSTIVKIMPKRNRLVVALIYDGLCTFEFGIAAEIFGLPRPEMGANWYRFITCAEDAGPKRAGGGVSVIAEAGLDRMAGAGTIVVPGWRTDGVPPSPALREAMLGAHGAGARIVTICSGAFLPAALGLLEGRRVATHWRHAERLRTLHPDLTVDAEVLYVDGGDVLTSAGSAAGVDLLLHIVRKDFGPDAANQVARRLVMPPHREGGQAQYIERPVPLRPAGRLAPLLDSVRERPGEAWTIARLARVAAMSERTFLRRFHQATGTTPGDWLVQLRTDIAKQLLEAGRLALADVAQAAGFGSPATLRHHFRQRVGVSPAAYRAQFAPDRRFTRSRPA